MIQLFCFSFQTSVQLSWFLVLVHRNMRYKHERSVGTPQQCRVSPRNYFAQCHLSFKCSPCRSSIIFFLRLHRWETALIFHFKDSQSSLGLLFILQACSVHPVPLSSCHIFQTTLSYPVIELQAQVTCARYCSNLFCCSPLMASNMQHMCLMGDLEMHTTYQGRVPGRI